MNKKLLILFALVIISLISFISCEPLIENKITIRNLAAGGVVLNLRAQAYTVGAGQTLVLSDFKKGTFEFETLFSLPAGVTRFSAEGDVSGNMVLNAGTEVLLIYTSVTDSQDSTYTIYGSMTTTDDFNRVDPFAVDGTP